MLVFVSVVSATILLLVQVDVPCCQLWGWKKNNLVALGSDKNPAYAVDKQPSRETSNAETIGSEEWFYTECETAVMTSLGTRDPLFESESGEQLHFAWKLVVFILQEEG